MADGQGIARDPLAERYGGDRPRAPHEHGLSGLLSHRSVRQYTAQRLPDGTLELLVAAAQSAASSSNLQLWSVISVEDEAKRAELAELAGGQAHVRQSGAFLVWLADLHRATALARNRELPSVGLEFLEMFLMASVDAALAAQNAVVAAESLGLGTVYIGALRNQPERVARILNLPERVFAVFGLCVGYADEKAATAVKPRLPQSVVLGRDGYPHLPSDHAPIHDYDRTMQRFYADQQMAAAGDSWTQHSLSRVQNIAALRGRDRLRQALGSLGFALR